MIISAYEIPNLRFSLPAGLEVMRHRFVKMSAEAAGVPAAASTDAVIGASMNQVKKGEVLEVADGIVIVEAGGVIAAGDTVVAAADGKAVKGTGRMVAFTAAAAAGEFVAVKI